MLVHVDDNTPVVGNLSKVQGLGQVDDIEDILLETANAVNSLPGDDFDGCLTCRQSPDQPLAYGDRSSSPTRKHG